MSKLPPKYQTRSKSAKLQLEVQFETPAANSTTFSPFQRTQKTPRSPLAQTEPVFTFDWKSVEPTSPTKADQSPDSNPTSNVASITNTAANLKELLDHRITPEPRSPQPPPSVESPVQQPEVIPPTNQTAVVQMANTTITEAMNAGKKPTVPQFISPPTFHPSKTSATSFLNSYERTSIANGWDDSLKISYLETFLEGAAHLWFQRYKADNADKTWLDIRDDFKTEFEDTDSCALAKERVENRKQKSNETVREYFYDLQVIYSEYRSTTDFAEFRTYFEKGLQEDTFYHYYWLTHSPNKPPSDMKELKELTITIDKAPKRVAVPQNEVSPLTQADSQSPQRSPTQKWQTNSYTQWRQPYPQWQRRHYTDNRQRQHYNHSKPNFNHQRSSQAHEDSHQRNTQRPHQHTRFNSRTLDNRPRCYRCNKPGHFAVSCRTTLPNQPHPNAMGRHN
jgi:Retrotransposon gag protein/Zinc knuckle